MTARITTTRGTTGAAFDIPAMLSGLELNAFEPWRGREALEATWRDPEGFARALLDWQATRDVDGPRASRALEVYDFYADAIERRLATGGDALIFEGRGREGEPERLTVGDAHLRATALARAWAGAGARAGQLVCLVMPVGADLVVALLAALRLGLAISYLPPGGDLFLARRLALLAPDHIAASFAARRALGPFLAKALPEEGDPAAPLGEAPPSFEYPRATPLGFFFSACVEPAEAPRPVSAEDLYLRAVRDAAFAYGMKPAARFAAAGLDPLQHEPALLLASLLVGAVHVHATAADLRRDPGLLAREPFAAVGLGREARDALHAAGLAFGKAWGFWWKAAGEAADIPVWIAFSRECGLDPVPSGTALVEAAAGGALLFSARREKNPNLNVLPSAGAPFFLADLMGTGTPTVGAAGLFTLGRATDKEVAPTNHIVAELPQGEWFFVGPRDHRRAGRAVPREEVLAALADLPGAERRAIVLAPTASAAAPVIFVLLLFAGPDAEGMEESAAAAARDDLARRAREEIERRLGPGFVPDRVEVFPFYAREKDGAVDASWCQARYVTGMLQRRRRSRLAGLLARVRQAALASAPATGEGG